MTRILEPGEHEKRIAAMIQARVERFISDRALTPDQLGEKLGLRPLGTSNLRQQIWTLETAWRVAEALGVRVDVTTTSESTE